VASLLLETGPEPAFDYVDFAAWQRRRLEAGEMDREVGWWSERFREWPQALELPADRPRPPIKGWRGGFVTVAVPPEVGDGLRRLSRRQGASLFMTLLAGWQVLLHR